MLHFILSILQHNFERILIIKITYRNLAATIFLVAFIAQAFSGNIIIANYYTNNIAFAKQCINKDKPQLHCNGKCQLQKKLNQEDNRDKQAPDKKNETHIEVLSSKTFFAQLNLLFSSYVKKQYVLAVIDFPVDQSFQFFHPPQHLFA